MNFDQPRTEFDQNNTRPDLTQETISKIDREKPMDLAIAYKDNPEALRDRLEKLISNSEELAKHQIASHQVHHGQAHPSLLSNSSFSSHRFTLFRRS